MIKRIIIIWRRYTFIQDIKSDMKQMMNSLDERKDRITDQRARREEMRLMLSVGDNLIDTFD